MLQAFAQPGRVLRRSHPLRTLALAACLAAPVLAAAQAAAPHPCGDPFRNHFGPWDYRSAERANVAIVEKHHFTPGIEAMIQPVNTTMREMAQDVQYTLNVFPNHHRALLTMARLSDKHLADPPPGSAYSVDCWFDRAIRFRPDDTVVRSLYALQLAKRKRLPEAEAQLEAAVAAAKDNPLSHYNIGLVYFDIGNPERALAQAHKAMAMGVGRTELADKLKAAGKWRDPPAQ
jgi:tetratricopeptide (TPR) repeat protein